MNEQALYILCWNANRATEQEMATDVVQWLRMLHARCPRAVVLPVATRIDEVEDCGSSMQHFEKALRDTGESLRNDGGSLQIQPPVETSAKTGEGIQDFIKRVVSAFRNRDLFPKVGRALPIEWFWCRGFIDALRDGRSYAAMARRKDGSHLSYALGYCWPEMADAVTIHGSIRKAVASRAQQELRLLRQSFSRRALDRTR